MIMYRATYYTWRDGHHVVERGPWQPKKELVDNFMRQNCHLAPKLETVKIAATISPVQEPAPKGLIEVNRDNVDSVVDSMTDILGKITF